MLRHDVMRCDAHRDVTAWHRVTFRRDVTSRRHSTSINFPVVRTQWVRHCDVTAWRHAVWCTPWRYGVTQRDVTAWRDVTTSFGINEFPCRLCDRVFKEPALLKKHVQKNTKFQISGSRTIWPYKDILLENAKHQISPEWWLWSTIIDIYNQWHPTGPEGSTWSTTSSSIRCYRFPTVSWCNSYSIGANGHLTICYMVGSHAPLYVCKVLF